MSERVALGVIKGPCTVGEFKVEVLGESLGFNDYAELEHEGDRYLCMVKGIERFGTGLLASCIVVGRLPRTPFREGSILYRAKEETVRQALELTATEKDGLYIGRLKGLGFRVWLPVKKMGRVFIVGKPGSGKSYTVGVLIEELLKKNVPVVVIDPHGEYSSLKVEGDPVRDDPDVTIRSYLDQVLEFGETSMNPGADLGLEALKVAGAEDLVVQGQCTIVNLRGLGDEEQLSIVAETLNKLFQASVLGHVRPFYCVLDEAHRFAGKEKSESMALVKRFAQEGRKFGANLIVVTQRPQLLDTTVRGLVGTWIIHRLTDPNDVKIVLESGGLDHSWERDIAWLDKGEAIITGELVERLPVIVKVRHRETKHGAPGFNPLDFVKAEVREKTLQRIFETRSRLRIKGAELSEEQPILAPGLPQCFLSIKFKEEDIQRLIDRALPLAKAWISNVQLEYTPLLQYMVEAKVQRQNPPVEFKDSLRGFASLLTDSGKIDWKRSLKGCLDTSGIEDIIPQTKPPAAGRFARITIPLSQQSEVEDLMKGLKAYAALKMTKVVHHHSSLGKAAVGIDVEDFRLECSRMVDGLLQKSYAEIEEKFQAEAMAIDERIRALDDDTKALMKGLRDLNLEIERLKDEVEKARKEKKSVKRLRMSLEAKERRALVLKRKLEAHNHQRLKYSKAKDALAERKGKALKALRDKYASLMDGKIQSQVLQPDIKELSIPIFQVVWLPVFRAQLNISSNGIEKSMRISWNGINARGEFGACTVCHEEITNIGPIWMCQICLSLLCGEHGSVCTECQRTLCPQHVWFCTSCGRPFCTLEEQRSCQVCASQLCKNCSGFCLRCGSGTIYCKDHLKTCDLCRERFCERHWKEHTLRCQACGARTCESKTERCSVCGSFLCEACIMHCGKCMKSLCPQHTWTCEVCGQKLCYNEPRQSCSVCGRLLCEKDAFKCKACGSIVCEKDLERCPNCGNTICPNCLVTYRRILIKRKRCRLCSSQ
ncbi:DUF87 domain-containing protein [Candidatus Bathyarchaeota archaeon]|nr:DUF87 domain-containing protein [Candidatus Bathyarchaeota archaeon]